MRALKDNPKVSVLIPVYNYEQYVAKCIESVINQTYQNLEIIAVDDGSTDKSGFILDEYAQKDERLRVFHKQNGGIGSALKVAIESASGEYIAFLDSDDYMDLKAYEELVDVAVKNNADIVMYGVRMIALDGHIRSEATSEPAVCNSNDEVMRDYVCQNTVTPLSRKFIKAQLLSNLTMMDYSVGIDETISIQIMAKCNKLVKIKNCYYNAVGEPGKDSVSRRAIDGKNVKEQINMHRDIINYMTSNNILYRNEYIFRYLNFLIGMHIIVQNHSKNRDVIHDLIYEYKLWLTELKKHKCYKETPVPIKIKYELFKMLPGICSAIKGLTIC